MRQIDPAAPPLSRLITTYYAPPACLSGQTLTLPEEEAHHAVRVLRQRVGDQIEVVDGEGGWYRVRLDRVDRKRAEGTILERRTEVGEPSYRLTMGVAVLKNPGRFETFLEKATELGVSEVVPLYTERTVREHLKEGRARRILVAAMKQCGRSRLVHLAAPQRLPDFIGSASFELGMICHEEGTIIQTPGQLLQRHGPVRSLGILVGPEGGFTQEEVRQSEASGFVPVTLGPRRLRAETAGIVAATAVMLHQIGE